MNSGPLSVNVLVTSAGTASAINVIKALRDQQEYSIHIVAVDADATAPGLYLADRWAEVPKHKQDEYIPSLLRLCSEHNIRALYPIHSQEIEVITKEAARFAEREIGLLVPTAESVRLCNDKRRMYALAGSLGICTPRPVEDGNPLTFPLFAKPNVASGSSGARRIEDEGDYELTRHKCPNFIFQEFVDGVEYTVDVLCDWQSNLIVGSPRLRLATKDGQCVKGRSAQEPQLIELCSRLCKSAGIVGPCNIQFIRSAAGFVFIELNPRYAAGGLMLTVRAGANLPFLALKLILGENVIAPPVRPGVTMLRYWEEVFVDGQDQSVP